jgi:hypothetical protein
MTNKIPILLSNLNFDYDLIYELILLNKSITKVSQSNLYEILFKSKLFEDVFEIIKYTLTQNYQENFDCYVQNLQGYISNEENNQKIQLNKNQIKDYLIIPPKYSFILPTNNEIKIELIDNIYELNKGNVLIFNTQDFLSDKSENINNVCLIGTISNDINNFIKNKTLL